MPKRKKGDLSQYSIRATRKKQREMGRLTQRKKNGVLPTLTVTERHAAQSVSLLVVHGVADQQL